LELMADAREEVGKVEELEKRLEHLRATESRPSGERLATLDALATSCSARGRHRESLALTGEAISILETHFPERTADLFAAMGNLASGYLVLEEYDKAEKLFQDILARSDSALKARPESIAAIHHQLGSLYFQRGDYLNAEKSLSLALTLKKQLFGDAHPQVGMTLNNLAAVYTVLGHPSAARMADEARRLLETPTPPPRATARRAARVVSVRCLDPGERAAALLGPLLDDLGRSGFAVERVFTPGEGDLYEEGILPPIVTVYLRQVDLADAASAAILPTLARSLAATVERFRTAGVSGYGGGPRHKASNDAGIFVQWNEEATVRYYFLGESYAPSAFAAIPLTFANVAARIQPTGHCLRNIVLWTDDHWQWLQPGSGNSVVD
jgi:hypothetical protein